MWRPSVNGGFFECFSSFSLHPISFYLLYVSSFTYLNCFSKMNKWLNLSFTSIYFISQKQIYNLFFENIKNAVNYIKIYFVNFTLFFNIFADTILWICICIYVICIYILTEYILYPRNNIKHVFIHQSTYLFKSVYVSIYLRIDLAPPSILSVLLFACLYSLVVYFFDCFGFWCNLFLTSCMYLICLNCINI